MQSLYYPALPPSLSTSLRGPKKKPDREDDEGSGGISHPGQDPDLFEAVDNALKAPWTVGHGMSRSTLEGSFRGDLFFSTAPELKLIESKV